MCVLFFLGGGGMHNFDIKVRGKITYQSLNHLHGKPLIFSRFKSGIWQRVIVDVWKVRSAFIFRVTHYSRTGWSWSWRHYGRSKRRKLFVQLHSDTAEDWNRQQHRCDNLKSPPVFTFLLTLMEKVEGQSRRFSVASVHWHRFIDVSE